MDSDSDSDEHEYYFPLSQSSSTSSISYLLDAELADEEGSSSSSSNTAVKSAAAALLLLHSSNSEAMKSDSDIEIPTITLEIHEREVVCCAWHPSEDVLATGSGDSTGSICCAIASPVIIFPLKQKVEIEHNDVTSLDWNCDGTLLATGSRSGSVYVWNTEGRLINTLKKHKKQVNALKWYKNGEYILSGSVDETTVIWNFHSGHCIQQFSFHSGPVRDVDWQFDYSFASCSTDKCIYVCRMNSLTPIKTFIGHTDEIGVIKWSPHGKLLASCSDDFTVKIWSMDQDTCCHNFNNHSSGVVDIKWSPIDLLLASASLDSTICLWNVEEGSVTKTLKKHTDSVYSVAFSPDGKYLASGGLDSNVHIWNVQTEKLVGTYNASDDIFEVCWNANGTKVGACAADGNVFILDLTNLTSSASTTPPSDEFL